MNRRQFLRGAGGFALALPTLSSLLPREARATEGLGGARRFICITSHHGGVWGSNMYPSDATLTASERLSGGHVMRHGALDLQPDGALNRLSPCLSASSSALTPALASRMNVLRGLDIPFYINHHTGGYLGNFARNDAEYEGHSPATRYRPTIDQLMARSGRFYDDLSGILRRSIHIGLTGQFATSWRHTNPDDPSSAIISSTPAGSSQSLFDQIFRDGLSEERRQPVVDHVLESYRNLRSGAFGDARRLSAHDRQRLDDHMDRLAELERNLNTTTACEGVSRPTGNADESHPGAWYDDTELNASYYQLYNEVLAIALSCDTSRIVTLDIHQSFQAFSGDWHQDVAHRLAESDRQSLMLAGQRGVFEHVFVDLCNRLMVDQGNGITVLDDSLVMWAQESGAVTHDPVSLPVVMAGSAGGALRTGNYVDYRDQHNTRLAGTDYPEQRLYRPGLYYSQWLGTVLQAMGLPHADWGRSGEPGYGEEAYDWWARDIWSDAVRAQANDMLPIIRA